MRRRLIGTILLLVLFLLPPNKCIAWSTVIQLLLQLSRFGLQYSNYVHYECCPPLKILSRDTDWRVVEHQPSRMPGIRMHAMRKRRLPFLSAT